MLRLHVPDHTRPESAEELIAELHKLEALNIAQPDVRVVSVCPGLDVDDFDAPIGEVALVSVGLNTEFDDNWHAHYSFKSDGRVTVGSNPEEEKDVPGGWRGGVAAVVEDAIKVLDGLKHDADRRIADLKDLQHGLEVHLTTP